VIRGHVIGIIIVPIILAALCFWLLTGGLAVNMVLSLRR
jgi:hypothetical protein